jgi:ribosome-binding factor A
MENRNSIMTQLIKENAAQFLERESNHMSLITVTDVKIAKDNKRATIFFTVLPDHKTPEALAFVNRLKSDFYKYFLTKVKAGRVPLFDFAVDMGEKHRQKIDDIANTL